MIWSAAPKVVWAGRTRTLAFCLVAVLVAATIGVLLAANPAHAATFTVNSTSDRVDERPGNGSCYTGVKIVHDNGGIEGECTLRAAIQEANALAGADTINFFILTTEDSNCDATTKVCTIRPASQLPRITQPLTINGYTQPGASVNTATTGTNAVLKIVLDGSNAGPFSTDGLFVTASNSTVKGLVINGFSIGVLLLEETPSQAGRTVEGCFIGTDATGTAPSPNGLAGVFTASANNVIGGTTLAARNLISGNSGPNGNGSGVELGSEATGNRIEGNLIGTKKDGTAALSNNASGVQFLGGSGNTIGGNGAARNTIAFNGKDGVTVAGGTGNSILNNSIHSNLGLGINLSNDGVTPNDPKDPDAGPNTLQNFPAISSAVTSGGSTTIKGNLNSIPNRTFTLQFFSSLPALADTSGFGEGKTFITQRSVTTNSNGNASFEFVPKRSVPVGNRVTVTATNGGGSTSEFSRARIVVRPI